MMKNRMAAVLVGGILLFGSAGAGLSSVSPADVKFASGPTFTRTAEGKYRVEFTLSAPADVEVAILDAQGKTVRSLAAGVLGAKNAPPEPLKPGLTQSLEWDGKGDWNLPVGAGPYKARVRAGMGVKFGGMVGDSPYNFREMICSGMAVDPKNGDLYYLARRGRDASLFNLRVYDRTGKYLRELLPYPATLDAKSRQAFGEMAIPGSQTPAPMNYNDLWPNFYPFAQSDGRIGIKIMGLDAARQEVLLLDEFFGTIWRIRAKDGGAGAPFAEPLWESGKGPTSGKKVGPIMGAVSPDGATRYFTGFCLAGAANWPEGRVYRRASGKTERFADVELPAGWKPAEEPWAMPTNGNQALHGIAVEKSGNVLVCDTAAGKVRIFSPEGKEAGAIDAPGAYDCVPDPRGEALYVTTVSRIYPRNAKLGTDALIKFDSPKPGAKSIATLPLKADANGYSARSSLAVDFSGPAPQIWLSRDGLQRIEDRDGKFTVIENLDDRGRTSSGFAMRLDVDPEAELVYINNGWSETFRFNGLTGEYAGNSKNGKPEPIVGSEFCVRRDGMVYVSGAATFSGPWARFNRDLSPAPFADGRKEFLGRYGKMGGGYFGNQGSCVTPDGRLYFNGMIHFRINSIFEVNPDGSPGRGTRLTEFLTEKPAQGGFKGALIGPVQDKSGGVKIDQKGYLYVGMHLKVDGVDVAPELARVQGIGDVIKFRPDGGALLPDPDKYKPGAMYEVKNCPPLKMPEKIGEGLVAYTSDGWAPAGGGKKFLDGALKAYPLLAPFGYKGCACQTPRFDVDDYGRLYIPNAYTCSVRVIDNEGNEITRFGSYGNFDAPSAGTGTEIPLAYPVAAKASFRHLYVADSANRRVVRVDPTWKLEAVSEAR